METENKSKLPPDQRAFLDAAKTGNAGRVHELLAQGVPVDLREDFSGGEYYQQSEQTALMYAAGGGHLEVVRLLLKAGANVNALDKMFSREYGGEQTPLHYAARQPNVTVVEELLNAGADPNAVTKNIQNRGNTPLIYALRKGHQEVVQLLVKRGTNLSSKIGRKRALSPLVALIQASNDEVSDETVRDLFLLLLAAGADPNGTGDANQTAAFSLAAMDVEKPNHLSVEIASQLLEKLLQAGAKADWPDDSESTPLENALVRKNPPALKLLLAAGADVNRLFQRGTALDISDRDIKLCEEDLQRLKNSPPPADEKRAAMVKKACLSFEAKLQRCHEIRKILLASGAKRKAELS